MYALAVAARAFAVAGRPERPGPKRTSTAEMARPAAISARTVSHSTPSSMSAMRSAIETVGFLRQFVGPALLFGLADLGPSSFPDLMLVTFQDLKRADECFE